MCVWNIPLLPARCGLSWWNLPRRRPGRESRKSHDARRRRRRRGQAGRSRARRECRAPREARRMFDVFLSDRREEGQSRHSSSGGSCFQRGSFQKYAQGGSCARGTLLPSREEVCGAFELGTDKLSEVEARLRAVYHTPTRPCRGALCVP